MRRLTIGTGAALIALAGCGDTTSADENAIEVPGPEAYQQELQSMEEGARNAVFIRAIRDAGQECQHVESSSLAGEEQGFPVWEARCAESGVWKIVIQNDGVAQVVRSTENPDPGMDAGGNAQAPLNPEPAQ